MLVGRFIFETELEAEQFEKVVNVAHYLADMPVEAWRRGREVYVRGDYATAAELHRGFIKAKMYFILRDNEAIGAVKIVHNRIAIMRCDEKHYEDCKKLAKEVRKLDAYVYSEASFLHYIVTKDELDNVYRILLDLLYLTDYRYKLEPVEKPA